MICQNVILASTICYFFLLQLLVIEEMEKLHKIYAVLCSRFIKP